MSLWSRIERRLTDFAGDLLPDEFRLRVVAARELLQEGRADEAEAQLNELVEERPQHVMALCLLGAAQLELGKAEEAAATFGRAMSERSDEANALVGFAQASLELGKTRDAIDAFRGAIGTASGDRAVLADAYRGLGVAYRRSGDLDKAIRELRKAVAESEDDPIARAALGEALLTDERVSATEASRHLELAVSSGAAPAVAYLALGRIALDDGDSQLASEYFAHAREKVADERGALATEARFQALLGLGDAAMLGGDTSGAYQCYLEALALDARSAAVHARVGDVHRRIENLDAALASYQRSLDLARDADVLRRALDTALEGGDITAAVRLANELLSDDPSDTRAMVARGVALARQGQTDAARATFKAVLDLGVDSQAHLALGRLELDSDPSRAAGARAALSALAALRIAPDDARARKLLAESRARELGDGELGDEPGDRSDSEPGAGELASDFQRADEMYRLAERFGRIAVARSELAGLAAEAAQAVADFDQPLLVTVMGEFSSGKSSFVNAFVGDEVAPTGITPTTATINIVKYGRERGGRILYRDGSIETVDWGQLFPTLRALPTERIKAIELVEILLPLPQLERVNIVDTPGLNSILPEHEETARGFIARADAVVWLFTANQAGKSSERKALARIQEEGKRVLGVLNKKDQLSPTDVDQLVTYVQGELDDKVEVVVPFSARQALAHKRATRAAGADSDSGKASDKVSDDGNWQQLSQALEERFFTQARNLKRAAAGHRLASLLDRARTTVTAQRVQAENTAAALRAQADQLLDAGTAFIDRVVVDQRAGLSDAMVELYRRAAREVLELVRPRDLPIFDSHSATPADRDYLLSMLESGYEAALEHSRRQVVASLQRHVAPSIQVASRFASVVGEQSVSDVARTGKDAVRLVEAQVYERTRAFLRGYLAGGFVGKFFEVRLPKMSLDEDSVFQALFHDAPDLDTEIALPLARAGTLALQTLSQRLVHWSGVAEVLAYDLESGLLRALDSLEHRRQHLTDPRG